MRLSFTYLHSLRIHRSYNILRQWYRNDKINSSVRKFKLYWCITSFKKRKALLNTSWRGRTRGSIHLWTPKRGRPLSLAGCHQEYIPQPSIDAWTLPWDDFNTSSSALSEAQTWPDSIQRNWPSSGQGIREAEYPIRRGTNGSSQWKKAEPVEPGLFMWLLYPIPLYASFHTNNTLLLLISQLSLIKEWYQLSTVTIFNVPTRFDNVY